MWKYPKCDEAGDGGEGNGGGGGDAKWHDGLPTETIAHEMVQNAPDLDTFVKQAMDTASHVGSSIRIPGPDAGPEATVDFHKKLVERVPGMYYMPDESDPAAQQALYQKLGKPTELAGYEIAAPEGANDVEKELSNALVSWANELDMTKKQTQGIYAKWNEFQASKMGDFKKFNEGSVTQLKAEWGAAYDSKMAGVKALMEKSDAPESMVNAFNQGDMDGPTIKWASDIAGKLMSGTPVILDQQHGSSEIMTPAEARAQISEIMGRKEYWDQGNAAQKGLVDKVVELQALANPGASTEPPARL